MKEFSVSRLATPNPEISAQLYKLAALLRPQLISTDFDHMLESLIAFPSAHLLVARREEGEIQGMLTLVSYPLLVGYNKTWIEDVVVAPEARGQGIGTLLLQKALDIAREMGVGTVNLTSRPELESANKLYQRFGFIAMNTNYYRYTLK